MKTMCKFILMISIMLVTSISSFAKKTTVGYSHKGCHVECNVAKQDSNYYIIVTLSSGDMRFLSEPTMMLKTFDGEVLKLTGVNLGEGSKATGGHILYGGGVSTHSEVLSTAQFKTTPAQLETISKGIEKIRLSTTPNEHEKTFNKDKIGEKLYEFYLKLKDKDDDF